ncbi:MAG: hypothetical protein DRQ35_05820 [Gammaproteobacteria bacterium]|nr:MAG: hypothetical protein DRQ35_05820 [Gammaproteobacteria bacterium]
MHNDRIIDLGEDIRNHTFETLDAEPEITGADAGKVAAAVEEAFVKTLQAIMWINEPPTSQGGNLTQTPPGSSLVNTDHIKTIRDNGWSRS